MYVCEGGKCSITSERWASMLALRSAKCVRGALPGRMNWTGAQKLKSRQHKARPQHTFLCEVYCARLKHVRSMTGLPCRSRP
jgi:uncharacterized protein YlaI